MGIALCPTPEKSATSMLVTARMELFAAEQRVIDAKLQADYWCTRVSFLEVVQKQGIDPWVNAQAQRPTMHRRRPCTARPARVSRRARNVLHGVRAGCGEGLAVAIRATRTLSRTGASF